MKVPTLTTERLILRPFTDADIEPMYQIISAKDVMRYFPPGPPITRQRAEKMVQSIQRHWEEYEYGLWAWTLREGGQLMGRVGLQRIPETGEMEVDFILGRDFWSQGYATEAGRASLRFAMDHLDPEFIVGIVHPENIASQRVLEKIGLLRVERTRYFDMDCYLYEIRKASDCRLRGPML